MLNNIPKILTGDLLKALCDMGHGDELVIADGNYPAYSNNANIIEFPIVDTVELLKAILQLFPLDTYSNCAYIMDLTQSDKDKGMPNPEIWNDFEKLLNYKPVKLEREEFYQRSKKAYVVIKTCEERQYANLILVKGVVK